MGMAINKYYEKNKVYPEDLMDLHPEFIPLASFIEEIDWYYEPEETDFYLSKSIKRGKMRLTAFIDKDLAPAMEGAATIASVDRKKSEPAPAIQEMEDFSVAALPSIQQIEPALRAADAPVRIIERPEIVSVTTGDIGLGVSPEISKNTFVWRDANGHLGFGNTTYPERGELSIYKNNTWFGIKNPEPRPVTGKPAATVQAKEEKNPDAIALKHSRNLMVWKDKNGVIGYGNAQGPRMEKIAWILVDGSWLDIREGRLGSTAASPETPVSLATEDISAPLTASAAPASLEEIASQYSSKYMIWKDKNGVIGYGNAQGPDLDKMSAICVNGEWIDIDTAFAGRRQWDTAARGRSEIQGGPEASTPPTSAGAPASHEAVAAQYGGKYVIWKDKSGVIGFGNVQEPGPGTVSAVLAGDEWIEVEAPLMAKRPSQKSTAIDKGADRDPEKVASEYSGTYLIWKDKSGSIGYGNVQYPEEKEIEYICVNGSWQKVAH
jgi:hypothetical protein